MKTERKRLSINHIFLITTLVMWCWTIGSASAEECLDLVVDREEVTVDGGCYGIIFVKNNGALTINGDTTAQAVLLRWGIITVNGSLDVADYITVEANPTGTMTVNGDVSAKSVTIESGELHLCGNWFVNDMHINGGVVKVIPYSGSLNGSGTFKVERGFITVNDAMQTSVLNIYAIGDVTGKLLLAHCALAITFLN